MSAGFTNFVAVPAVYQHRRDLQTLYCMALCEMATSCIGFDFYAAASATAAAAVGRSTRCAFLASSVLPASTFDVYVRSCD